jgi:ribosome-binding factor A
MVIGILQFELVIEGAESLKDKRSVVRSVKDRLHREHQVSVAEVASQDSLARAVLGLACVATDGARAGQVLDQITAKLRAVPGAELGDCTRQIVHGSQLTAASESAVDDEALAREMLARFDQPEGEPMNRHLEQLAAEVRSAVQQAIDRGLADPRISGMITITSCRVSADGKSAYLDVSILPAEKQDLTMHGLKSAAAHLRHQIGKVVRTRQIPGLVFRLDETLKKQADVLEAISRAAASRRPDPASEAGPGPDAAYAQDRPSEGPRS